jgi:hypothetical protein
MNIIKILNLIIFLENIFDMIKFNKKNRYKFNI